MNTKTKKVKNKLKNKQVGLMEIHHTVKYVVTKDFDVSNYYINSFIYKIYCKLSVLFTAYNKREIAKVGGFKGEQPLESVNRAIAKYDLFYLHDNMFQEIAKACKVRLHDSNGIEDSYRDLLIEQLNSRFFKYTDNQLQELLTTIENGN
tara:strand:- start:10042 stop:10488 length:447 start_codon:yes stop_codon:yes gene_type:complete